MTNFNTQNLVTGELGHALQHLATRNLIWIFGNAIARHPSVASYGLSKKEISEGNGNTPQIDGIETERLDLERLLKGFLFLEGRLKELSSFEDYDPRTGAPTTPFAWYQIPTMRSYIYNFQSYRIGRVDTERQDQAKALGLEKPLPIVNRTSELDELVHHAMETIRGFTPTEATYDDFAEAVADMRIDPLYIVHQSALNMLDRARSSLLAGKSGYIDPEILAFARWTCRPHQGMQAPD